MTTGTAYAKLFSFLLTIGFLSCGLCSKKIACPGYRDELLDSWFPYGDGQQLRFRSNAGEEEMYTLMNTETTQPYEARSAGFSSPIRCEAQKFFQSVEKDTLNNSKAPIILLSPESHKMASFSFGKNTFNISLVGETSATVNMGNWNMVLAQSSTATFGNRTFTNLLEATGDTSGIKNPGVYKVYFAKGEGIIAFSEYPSLKTWIIQ